jgi:hypothetical protein
MHLMKNRRVFLLAVTSLVACLAVVVAPVIAEELLGVITKVDVEGKKLTVVEKDTDKEVEITTTDKTEYVSKKGNLPLDLEKLSGRVKKAQEKGEKGVSVKVEHEKGVASKLYPARKKAAEKAN